MRDTTLAWAEYELRRRVHFALELILSALVDTLMNLTEATIVDVITEWSMPKPLPKILSFMLPAYIEPFDFPLQQFGEQMADDVFFNDVLDVSTARKLNPAPRTLYALGLLVASYRQTSYAGKIPDHYMEQVFSLLRDHQQLPLREVLTSLLNQVVVEAHLSTTLRKMGQGQKCSLRFYPEGEILRPTGTPVGAGFSGDRLSNVLGMLSDIGLCMRESGGRFVLSEQGRTILVELNSADETGSN